MSFKKVNNVAMLHIFIKIEKEIALKQTKTKFPQILQGFFEAKAGCFLC